VVLILSRFRFLFFLGLKIEVLHWYLLIDVKVGLIPRRRRSSINTVRRNYRSLDALIRTKIKRTGSRNFFEEKQLVVTGMRRNDLLFSVLKKVAGLILFRIKAIIN
jgi:hypothetical protein